jgi:hypothetical protein
MIPVLESFGRLLAIRFFQQITIPTLCLMMCFQTLSEVSLATGRAFSVFRVSDSRINVNEFSNKQFFEDIAAILGFDIVVEDRDEDPSLGPFEFLVTTSSDLPSTSFRVGESRAGERLVNPGAQEPLEALIEFFAPAHTTPSFFYASNLIAENGDNLIAEDGDNLIG